MFTFSVAKSTARVQHVTGTVSSIKISLVRFLAISAGSLYISVLHLHSDKQAAPSSARKKISTMIPFVCLHFFQFSNKWKSTSLLIADYGIHNYLTEHRIKLAISFIIRIEMVYCLKVLKQAKYK